MSVTKISFRAVTNIVKAGCKSNKLVGLILPNRILYYTNIAIIAHSPILSDKKSYTDR